MLRFARHPVFQRLAAMLFVLAALAAGALTPAANARPTNGSDTRHAAHLAGPAVVRIINQVYAIVRCKRCATNGGDFVFPDTSHEYVATASGSGAFVSPDGYVLTAYHVVDAICDDEQNGPYFLDRARQTVRQAVAAQGGTQAQADALFDQWSQNNQLAVQCADREKTSVFLSTSYTGKLQAVSQVKVFQATTVAASPPVANPIEGDDTAILKIQVQDMPFVTPAPASAIHIQDAVVAVAYPGDIDEVDFSVLLQPAGAPIANINDLLSPTIESGSIIAEKTKPNSGSTRIYDTSNLGFHGSSGGPVLNTDGQLVGFVEAGPANARYATLIESSVVAKYLQQAGISQPQGAFETLWAKSVGEYDASGPCHWTHANTDLQQLHQQYPQFGGAQSYLDTAQSNATPNECSTSTTTSGPPGTVIGAAIGGGLLLVAVIVLLLVLRGQRRPPEPTAAAPVTAGTSREPDRYS